MAAYLMSVLIITNDFKRPLAPLKCLNLPSVIWKVRAILCWPGKLGGNAEGAGDEPRAWRYTSGYREIHRLYHLIFRDCISILLCLQS